VSILADKAVIITGAGAGLGRAYAEHAAREGALLVLNDVSAESARALSRDFEAEQGKVVVSSGDVSDWKYAQSLAQLCLDHHGRIDGLVNNAGIYYYSSCWDDYEERLSGLYATNVMGALFCGIPVMRAMIGQRSGSIVNVTSGSHVGITGLSAYGGTKGAVASLTYGWALELREFGVRVNAVSPRAVTREAAGRPAEDTRSGLLWSPEHAAPLVSYLLSDLAENVTGQIVRLSGEELSIMSHPWETKATATKQVWGVGEIAEAFGSTFSESLRPVGLNASSYLAPAGSSAGRAGDSG
jgi:NAD(P)-dependent dehydrogenase (short-subunit alcohol dehydrogenase family)